VLLKYKYQTVLVTLVIVLIHFSRMILQTLQHYSLNNRALKSPVHSLTLGLSVTLFLFTRFTKVFYPSSRVLPSPIIRIFSDRRD